MSWERNLGSWGLSVDRFKFILFLLLPVVSGADAGSVLKRWTMVERPTVSRKAQSIGGYSAGCLSGAVRLPVDGEGYQAMRLSRKRLYGHPELIRFVKKMGHHAAVQGWGELLIGDLGQPRGGPTLTGHRSHQTGLDVDIWYRLSAQAARRPLTFAERETWQALSMLRLHSDRIDDAHWSNRQVQVLKTAAQMPEVERIFVNPVIKRWLCEHQTEHAWLSKIRPWWGHDDHFHVRLQCPPNSPDCLNQPDVPAGSGCDATLAWWFTDEARAALARRRPAVEPKLPAQCETVLQWRPDAN